MPRSAVSGEVPVVSTKWPDARPPDRQTPKTPKTPKTQLKFEGPYVSRERNTMPVRGLGLK